MSVAIWPTDLPQRFLRDGLTIEGADNLIATEMSVGPAKLRRRSNAAVRPIAGAMVMTRPQYDRFTAFVAGPLLDRVRPFLFPDPLGGDPLFVRMPSPHRASVIGRKFRVDLVLEVLP